MGGYAELAPRRITLRARTRTRTRTSRTAARAAVADGLFADEIVPVSVPGAKRGETVEVTHDDEPATPPRPASKSRPAFKKENGTVTAANASTISDGAAAVILMSRAAAEQHGCKVPRHAQRPYGDAEQEPAWFTTAPSKALPIAAKRAGIGIEDVDYFEINEAFSVVSVVNNRLLNLDPDKVNVNGGAVALGHPDWRVRRADCRLVGARAQAEGREDWRGGHL